MLHEFITMYQDAIVVRTRQKLTNRPWPLTSTSELEHGVPRFLAQLSETLRLEQTAAPFEPGGGRSQPPRSSTDASYWRSASPSPRWSTTMATSVRRSRNS